MNTTSHHAIRESLLGRIKSGEWPLGSLIPGEQDLATEYGCARTTINRALQAIAEAGLVIRKRKGGTRVCERPVRQAKFEIPIIREQVEAMGSTYRHQLLLKEVKTPPSAIFTRLHIAIGVKALHLETIHLADDRPYAFEERWVNIQTVPKILEAPLETISANEWLVQTAPFSSGDVMFYAVNATEHVANAIETKEGAAIFVIDRTTWFEDDFITTMKLHYREGYQLYSHL
jgi:GntR family histidine utilization transcriptional repressor